MRRSEGILVASGRNDRLQIDSLQTVVIVLILRILLD